MKRFLFLLICMFLFIQPFSVEAFDLNEGFNILKQAADIVQKNEGFDILIQAADAVQENQKAKQKLEQQNLEDARNDGNKAKQRAEKLLSTAKRYGISISEKKTQLQNDLIVLDKVINENNPDKIDSATKYVTSSSDKFEAKLNIEKIPIDKQKKKAETARIGANKAKQRAEKLLSTAQGYGISMTEKEAQLKDSLIALDYDVINENNPDKIDSATKYVTSSSDKFEAKLNIEKIPIDKQKEKEAAARAKIEKERQEKEAAEKAKIEKERQEKEVVEKAKALREKREAEKKLKKALQYFSDNGTLIDTEKIEYEYTKFDNEEGFLVLCQFQPTMTGLAIFSYVSDKKRILALRSYYEQMDEVTESYIDVSINGHMLLACLSPRPAIFDKPLSRFIQLFKTYK